MNPSTYTLDEDPAVTACMLDILKSLTLSSEFCYPFPIFNLLTHEPRYLQDVLDVPLIIILTDGKIVEFNMLNIDADYY